MMEWAETQGIALSHTQPAKPQQNAYVERCNPTTAPSDMNGLTNTSLHH
jgi:transposase InsO family protein